MKIKLSKYIIILYAISVFTNILLAQMPARQPTPNDTLQSVRIFSNGKIKFSIYAPKASEVTVQGDFAPTFGANKLIKDTDGVWSYITDYSPKPDLYTYDFTVDGLKIFDPKNAQYKESNTGFSNLFEVKGLENEFQTLKNVPHGKVELLWYKSTALDGANRRLHVYLPPNYQSSEKLPVLYLLHGGGDNDASWTTVGRANVILDNLYAEGKLKRMLVVMPAGHTPIKGFFMGAGDTQDPFCRDFIADIIPFIQKSFKVYSDRKNRAIAGLSMGGIQTINLAIWHPELFAYVMPMSTGYFPQNIKEIEEKFSEVFKNKAINQWTNFTIFMGGEKDIAYQNNINMMALFDKYGIKYKYKNIEGGHTFLTWRKNLAEFAPLLFK